jgi:hypothetical protein
MHRLLWLAIIESLIEDCSKQGIIINLNKSKILLSKEQETQQAELLNNHAILKCFEQHNAGIYLRPISNQGLQTHTHTYKNAWRKHTVPSVQ